MSVRSVGDLAAVLRHLRRREARARGGPQLTYGELAEMTGWSRTMIGNYLSGKTVPPTDRFDALARLLGATGRELGMLATVRDRVEERQRLTADSAQPAKTETPADDGPEALDAPLPPDDFTPSLRALHASYDQADRPGAARALAGLASLAVSEGNLVRAARLFRRAETMAEASGIRMNPATRARYERDTELVRGALGSGPKR